LKHYVSQSTVKHPSVSGQFCHHFVANFLGTRLPVPQKQELIRRWDTWTWRDVSSYLFTYLPPNYK